MLTIGALKHSLLCHCNDTSFDLDRFAVYQGVRYLSMSGFLNATKRRSRYVHPCRRILLIKAFEIGKA